MLCWAATLLTLTTLASIPHMEVGDRRLRTRAAEERESEAKWQEPARSHRESQKQLQRGKPCRRH